MDRRRYTRQQHDQPVVHAQTDRRQRTASYAAVIYSPPPSLRVTGQVSLCTRWPAQWTRLRL